MPCHQKRKIDIDSSIDNTSLPCPKKDDKLIVSFNLKDLKSKVNVKDDSCSSLMVSLNFSNNKCKT